MACWGGCEAITIDSVGIVDAMIVKAKNVLTSFFLEGNISSNII